MINISVKQSIARCRGGNNAERWNKKNKRFYRVALETLIEITQIQTPRILFCRHNQLRKIVGKSLFYGRHRILSTIQLAMSNDFLVMNAQGSTEDFGKIRSSKKHTQFSLTKALEISCSQENNLKKTHWRKNTRLIIFERMISEKGSIMCVGGAQHVSRVFKTLYGI